MHADVSILEDVLTRHKIGVATVLFSGEFTGLGGKWEDVPAQTTQSVTGVLGCLILLLTENVDF